jgi:F0F1-type ATP synthase assembly protein I
VKKSLGPLKGYHLAMQISSILLCSAFGSLGAGLWLDNQLGTLPWLTLVFMILGIVVGMITIYRTVKEETS